jgi:hypothetical protein
MSWVRYDDGFYSHPKVGAVIHDDPGALSLHVLANTWSCQQKRPGFVPTHQPAVLVGNKTRGAKWAALLELHGLWDRVDGGWEFHDHSDYRESSKRSTPGTPADLSEKRRAAGRKGGKVAQQRKQSAKQAEQQTEQVAAQAVAIAVSPVVSTPNGALTPEPVPTTSGFAPINAGLIVGEYVRGATEAGMPPPDESLRKRVGKQAGAMLRSHDPQALATAAYNAGAGGWNDLAVQLQRDAAQGRGANGNADGFRALIQKFEAQRIGGAQ